jgi:hypothetical protein
LVAYEKETVGWKEFRNLLGGASNQWIRYLQNLKAKRKWEEIDAFCKIHTLDSYHFLGVVRSRLHKPQQSVQMQQTICGWANMHIILGEALSQLCDYEGAADEYGAAFNLLRYVAPEKLDEPMFADLLYDWTRSWSLVLVERPDPYGRLLVSSLWQNHRALLEEREAVRGQLPIDRMQAKELRPLKSVMYLVVDRLGSQ